MDGGRGVATYLFFWIKAVVAGAPSGDSTYHQVKVDINMSINVCVFVCG